MQFAAGWDNPPIWRLRKQRCHVCPKENESKRWMSYGIFHGRRPSLPMPMLLQAAAMRRMGFCWAPSLVRLMIRLLSSREPLSGLQMWVFSHTRRLLGGGAWTLNVLIHCTDLWLKGPYPPISLSSPSLLSSTHNACVALCLHAPFPSLSSDLNRPNVLQKNAKPILYCKLNLTLCLFFQSHF